MKTLITIDEERLEAFERLIQQQSETIAELQRQQATLCLLVSNLNKFYDLPEWITVSDALEIIRAKDKRTLMQAVAAGLVQMTGTGKTARYKKGDCLTWAVANDRLLRGEAPKAPEENGHPGRSHSRPRSVPTVRPR